MSQQEEEYLQLYRSMQAQMEAQQISDSNGSKGAAAAAAAAIPTPEAFVAALRSAADADAAAGGDSKAEDSSDDEADPDAERRNYRFPGVSDESSSLLPFRLAAWLPLLRRHTIPTRLVPLPADFVEYLCEDGVWMPEHLAPVQPDQFEDRDNEYDTAADRREEAARWRATVEELSSDEDEETEAEEAAAEARQRARQSQPFFPELVERLQKAMSELGGAVFPSLDWHAPTDASWISTERVAKCQSVGDLLLLLKSSDKVQTELAEPFRHCTDADAAKKGAAVAADAAATAAAADSAAAAATSAPVSTAPVACTPSSFTPTLALRKWSTLHPSKLFRCFVYSGELLAISQLDPNFYEFLQGEEERDAIQDAIEGWLEDESIAATLASGLGMRHAVMDLYVDMNERVWIVKLKPFWPKATDSLLFTWKELHTLAEAHDASGAAKEQHRAANPAPPVAPLAPPSVARDDDSAPLSVPASWPSSSSLSVPFRVISSAGAGLDVLRAVSNMATRFPADGFDVSDSAAIERWIDRVERGDLKQQN